jgi:phage terminase large subunit
MALGKWHGYQIDIVRQTLPSLRGSAYKDFLDILDRLGIYDPKSLNKSELYYELNTNIFQFYSIDDPQKYRGRKRHVLFINEANELNLESWRQLSMRTTDKIILDYNPSMEYHWIYDDVLTRDDVDFYKSTYLDNPFLEQSIIQEIERLKDVDDNYWKIYGLGERGQLRGLVFPQFNIIDEMPDMEYIYGLDWGYTNDPTAIIKVGIHNVDLYLDELVYQTGMMNNIVASSLQAHGLDYNDIIWADSAEPKSIAEVAGYGFNIKGADKGQDSVNAGLQMIRQHRINVTKRSFNLIKELRNYKWHTDKDGKTTNKPVDAFNHAIDALRYAVFMHYNYKKKEIFSSVI